MKYVEESLNKFQDEKFFAQLFEAEKKEEKISPDEKKKLALELQKQGMAVVKKAMDNFSRFKAAAGDKLQSYKDFWSEQKDAEQTIGREGMFYNLYDSYYIIGVVKNEEGNAELIVYNTDDKAKDDFETFVCKDKTAVKEFVKFFNGTLKATMKEVIANHKAAIASKKAAEAAQKKEEEAAAKRAKLDAFLKESENKKKVNESIVDEESLELIQKLSKKYNNPKLVADCAERLVAAAAVKILSGRSYAAREMREIQKKFSQEVINDAWDVKFELEDRLSDPTYSGMQNESLNESSFLEMHDIAILVIGALSTIAVPWIESLIKKKIDAKQLAEIQANMKLLAAKKKEIVKSTLKQLGKDQKFNELLKAVLINPVEGTKDMYLKGRGYYEPNRPLKDQPIKKTRMADYTAMQERRNNALSALKTYLETVLDEEQMSAFDELVKEAPKEKRFRVPGGVAKF